MTHVIDNVSMNISPFAAASATICRSRAGCCAASPRSPIGKATDHITVDLFLRWKDAFGTANNNTWSARLGMVRGFAGWLQGHDARTEVPPSGLIAGKLRRARPYIYSDAEVAMIVARAAKLPSRYGLRGWTCSTLFGLIAVTGLRINEAIAARRRRCRSRRRRHHREARQERQGPLRAARAEHASQGFAPTASNAYGFSGQTRAHSSGSKTVSGRPTVARATTSRIVSQEIGLRETATLLQAWARPAHP